MNSKSNGNLIRLIDLHLKLLLNEDLDVRISAGENIALIFETHQIEDTSPRSLYDAYDNLESILINLIQTSSKRHSKKDKSVQKASFRDIYMSVLEGEAPSVTLKVRNETVAFDDWRKIRQLESFRLALGDGFLVHLLQNPTVQQFFEFSDDKIQMNRRLFDTVVGKSRAKTRTDSRQDKLSHRSVN